MLWERAKSQSQPLIIDPTYLLSVYPTYILSSKIYDKWISENVVGGTELESVTYSTSMSRSTN